VGQTFDEYAVARNRNKVISSVADE
jgi:hypothetical protein